MSDADYDDICRVLAVCFRSGESLSDLDIERILSFDMGWLSPEEAGTAVEAMIDKGWLVGDQDSLTPALSNYSVTTPLGWFPRPSRLITPVQYDSVKFQEETISANGKKTASVDLQGSGKISKPVDEENEVFKDPRSKIERRLKRFVSKQSKLEIEEIDRRIQRKKNALGMVSNWLCIALIAREQGLEMSSIVDALSIN